MSDTSIPAVHAVVATVPRRRKSCERLLEYLTAQTRPPDLVHLVLDGYGGAEAPACRLPTRVWRTTSPLGPGGRWRIAKELPPSTVLVVIDDDTSIAGAPRLVESLAASVSEESAAAASGIDTSHTPVLWGGSTTRPLLAANAGTIALLAGHLAGIDEVAAAVRERFHFDPLGDCGDDEALVSALLWQKSVEIHHVTVRGLAVSAGTQDDAQTHKRRKKYGAWDWQRSRIGEVTGWPWPKRG